MKKRIKALYLVLAGCSILLSFSFFNKSGRLSTYHFDEVDEILFSANPPVAKTGAPGESNCTSCHAGSTQSAAGVVDFVFSEPSGIYYPDSSYSITVSVPSGVKNGFQLTVLDNNDNAAGVFTAGANSSTITTGGRNYILHSASSGITSWTFDWTAPSTDLGNLTAYYSFVKSNNSGSNSGDEVYLGQESINIAGDASFSDFQFLQNSLKTYANQSTKMLRVEYETLKSSHVELSLTDLSGKRLFNENLGQVSSGSQKHLLDYSKLSKSGVYIISLLIDNYAINQKVYML